MPVILVATKVDFRIDENDTKCISRAKGESLARLIGAIAFFECSSVMEVCFFIFIHTFVYSIFYFNKESIISLFECVITTKENYDKNKSKCSIM